MEQASRLRADKSVCPTVPLLLAGAADKVRERFGAGAIGSAKAMQRKSRPDRPVEPQMNTDEH